ncbi:MAG: hypothetical protein M3285_11785 [Actinomycetota bacterium]|nr:hypothetical protein [Actinomycetota bacterium]
MEREPGVPAESPQSSADTDEGLPSSEEDVDHAQSSPEGDEPPPDGPSIGDVFRSGS